MLLCRKLNEFFSGGNMNRSKLLLVTVIVCVLFLEWRIFISLQRAVDISCPLTCVSIRGQKVSMFLGRDGICKISHG